MATNVELLDSIIEAAVRLKELRPAGEEYHSAFLHIDTTLWEIVSDGEEFQAADAKLGDPNP